MARYGRGKMYDDVNVGRSPRNVAKWQDVAGRGRTEDWSLVIVGRLYMG
jgi:hypothetical protein